ncbi:Phage-related baseplate assembly protein [Planctomycetes bacterium Pan216]|uniref:Phage-related baseplate assembly protein n=1 Tax=Kolteria novifilia TaxID=2527975 RepID=A0A518B604_9BACT|nr:Phage-related baseplate assembly protein [Planctomycetes bacterium Pan216]
MSSVETTKRWLSIKTSLSQQPLLHYVEGSEGLSELFHFRLGLAVPEKGTIEYRKLLGRPATVTIEYERAPRRLINGMIKSLTQKVQDNEYTYYEAELVPFIWKATKNVQSRIFQQQKAQQILEDVFAGVSTRFELYDSYHIHNYCVQYQESDFDFASRLMEEEGIYYFFEHSDAGHVMVITDTSNLTDRQLKEMASIPYRASRGEGVSRDHAWVENWEKRQELCPDHFQVWDYNFELPEQDVGARELLFANVQAGTIEHDLSIEGEFKAEVHELGGYAHRFDGVSPTGASQASELEEIFQQNRRTARLHMEEAAAESLRIQGGSDAAHFYAGALFEFTKHFDGDGRYLLARVEHEAHMPVPLKSSPALSETKCPYRNKFTALPSDLTYRSPRKTPKPKIAGTQSAIVVGPTGEEIFTDKYGRVKVRFQWDRFGLSDGHDSCWVRVVNAWSGQQWGMITIPRVGQEVLIAFAEGDPDAPMVVGSAYNASQMPPFPLPEHRTRSCIKSHTHNGSAHEFHGLGFEDAAGEEWLQLHSQKDMMVNAKNNHFTNVANVKHTYTGHTHIHQVGNLAPMSGSGSGGDAFPTPSSAGTGSSVVDVGSGMGGDSATQFYKSEIDWGPDSVEPTIGLDIETVFGFCLTGYLGLFGEYIVGEHVETVLNPLGFLGTFGSSGASAEDIASGAAEVNTPWMKGLGAGVGGNLEVVFGQDTGMIYGPKVDIHRGPTVELTETWASAPPLTKALAGLYGGTVLMTAILPGVIPDKTASWISTLSASGVGGVLASLLAAYESKAGIVNSAKETVEQGEELTKQIESVSTPIASGLATAALDSAKLSVQLVGQALDETTAIAKEAVNATRNFNGNYTVTANGGNIAMVSKSNDDLGTASNINLDAQGAGANACNGMVRLNGTGFVLATAGPAIMSLANEEHVGEAILDCGAAGTIKLQSGTTMEPNLIMMDPEAGITSKSVLKILQQTAENSMTIDPEAGITLSVSEATTLTMTPASMTLKCGASRIELSDDGITLLAGSAVVALGSDAVSVVGPTLSLVGDGEVTLSTASFAISEG